VHIRGHDQNVRLLGIDTSNPRKTPPTHRPIEKGAARVKSCFGRLSALGPLLPALGCPCRTPVVGT
jgi:hypothetical protein